MILRNGKFSGKILRKIFHLTSLDSWGKNNDDTITHDHLSIHVTFGTDIVDIGLMSFVSAVIVM
jgi:hypothetical protein